MTLLSPKSAPVRGLKIAAGLALLIVGAVLALPGVPGPGIAIILLGLWMLSGHFEWAGRTLAWLRNRIPRRPGRKTAAG